MSSTLRTRQSRGTKMKIVLFFLSFLVRSSQLPVTECGTEERQPDVSDILVHCGMSSISLLIQICPVLYGGYNESLLILNYMMDPACRATLDESMTPPVARFDFPINMTHACGSIIRTTGVSGTGPFTDSSAIWMVNISGVIRSINSSTGNIIYNEELKYSYSCAYPLEDLINNTQLDMSASSIATRDDNQGFFSTLSMGLFSDASYTQPMTIPQWGIKLRTDVYVEVKATNLTSKYHVLLDRCYASISPLPSNSSFFNLFASCSMDYFTTIIENGDSQNARFMFPAFHFIEKRNETVSTYYLHCIAHLCDESTCATFKQCNSRRKRSAFDSSTATEAYTVTSPKIITKTDTSEFSTKPLIVGEDTDSAVRLSVAAGVFAFTCIVALCFASFLYKKLKN